MILFTKEIEKKLQAQYPKGSELKNQKVIAKIFDPAGSWTWYILNQAPDNPDYLWAIVKGFEVEMGSVSKSELENLRGGLGLPMERDLYLGEPNAKEVWEKLLTGKHV